MNIEQGKSESQPAITQAFQVDEPTLPSRHQVDWAPLIFWVCTLTSFVSAGAILLAMEDAGDTVEHDNMRMVYAFAATFFMFATVFNEALVERCWHRISLRALRGSVSGNNIRAANLSLFRVMLRLFMGSLSGRELTVAGGYLLLRGGTLVAVPVTQLTVHLRKTGYIPGQYHANVEVQRAGHMIAVAVIVHTAAVALGLACVGLPPWAAFSAGYDQEALQRAYEPYVAVVPGGSIATTGSVADFLDKPTDASRVSKLTKEHVPGLQILAKLKSMIVGMILTIVATGCLVGYLKSQDTTAGTDSQAYAFTVGCLFINLGFTLTLDQVVWNLSLEVMVKTSEPNASLSNTRFLGNTSGMMLSATCLLKKATNLRSRWLLWISLLQAVLVRTFFVGAIGMSNSERFKPADGRERWLYLVEFWAKMIGPSIGIPFLLFLLVPLRVPVGDFDGWRLAKVLEGVASKVDAVAYGVKDGKACSGDRVEAFSKGQLA
ncbi:hypothetical protein LRP88_04662 [Fusarium phalaenopsidis]